jgi:hypothetical protein
MSYKRKSVNFISLPARFLQSAAQRLEGSGVPSRHCSTSIREAPHRCTDRLRNRVNTPKPYALRTDDRPSHAVRRDAHELNGAADGTEVPLSERASRVRVGEHEPIAIAERQEKQLSRQVNGIVQPAAAGIEE